MQFASIRIITDDVARLAGFYEGLTGQQAERTGDVFAQLRWDGVVLAIGSTRTVSMLPADSALPASNRSAIVEFLVDDVDAEFARLGLDHGDVVLEPTTMPWGNRSLLIRDPDGNLVNLFSRPAA